MGASTSQATSTLVATDRPAGELVAYSQRPPRTLMEEWRRYVARRPPPRPAGPVVVELPRHLLN
jgi:hypothetical protein